MNVETYSGTWASGTGTSSNVAITAVSNLNTASIMGEMATEPDATSDAHRVFIGFELTALGTVTLTRGNDTNRRDYRFEVVEWPSTGDGGGGGEGGNEYISIPALTPTIKTISFWFNPDSTDESILQLSSSANVKLVAGAITTTGFTSPTIYVNGVATATTTSGWQEITITTATGITANDIELGRVGSDYFAGSLDEVRFYNRTLGSSEAASYSHGQVIFNPESEYHTTINASQNNKLTSGLIGLWSFDGPDVSGSTAYDRSGEGNDGTITGGAFPTIGVVGQALGFDGVDDKVDTGDWDSFGTTPFTVSAWVKGVGSSPSLGIIGSISVTTGWALEAHNGTARWYVNASTVSGASINNGTWHHVVGVRDGSTIYLYVDGVLAGSTTASQVGNSTDDSSSVYIGSWGSSGFEYAGSIDDVRVYDRALSASEIEQLYQVGR
jgi:hypothetical protein